MSRVCGAFLNLRRGKIPFRQEWHTKREAMTFREDKAVAAFPVRVFRVDVNFFPVKIGKIICNGETAAGVPTFSGVRAD